MRYLRSNALGLIAIFIVLGGTAIALPGKNRVNSGDIKQGAVRTLDLRREAVTKSKLRRNAVDGTRVRNNTLTDDDIDESTLGLPLGEGVVGEREEADRERRLVIGANELMPATAGDPQAFLSFGIPAIAFGPSEQDSAGATIEVPLERAAGSGLQVRLRWDANGTGDATWRVDVRTLEPGTSLGSVRTGPEVTSTSTAIHSVVETTVLDLPPGVLDNGEPLALTVVRNGTAPSDTLPVQAELRLVEIRYIATG